MTMNKTNIEWTHFTHNGFTGCPRRCKFGCYAEEIAENPFFRRAFPNGFELTYHPKRWAEPPRVKVPSLIFEGSMTDYFHDDVSIEWIRAGWDMMQKCPQHIFQLLTKNPKRMYPAMYKEAGGYQSVHALKKNVWLGTTIESFRAAERIDDLKLMDGFHKFISFEPLMDHIKYIDLYGIDWIIIGAQTPTKKVKQVVPVQVQWVETLLDFAKEQGVPVFMKDNLWKYLEPDMGKLFRQKFPKQMEDLINERNRITA